MQPSPLTQIRKARGLTTVDVADAMDTSNGTISRWERGEVIPPSSKLARLLESYDATPDETAAVMSWVATLRTPHAA